MEDLFDTGWLEEYENNEREQILHAPFVKEKISNIKIYIFYVNVDNNLEKINIMNQSLEENILTKQTLLQIIKSNTTDTFKILSIAKYNNTLDKPDLHAYINDHLEDTFLKSITSVDNINFAHGLCLFENIHSLYFLFFSLVLLLVKLLMQMEKYLYCYKTLLYVAILSIQECHPKQAMVV